MSLKYWNIEMLPSGMMPGIKKKTTRAVNQARSSASQARPGLGCFYQRSRPGEKETTKNPWFSYFILVSLRHSRLNQGDDLMTRWRWVNPSLSHESSRSQVVREEKERRERQREEWHTRSWCRRRVAHGSMACGSFLPCFCHIAQSKEQRTGSASAEIEGRKKAADNQRCQSTCKGAALCRRSSQLMQCKYISDIVFLSFGFRVVSLFVLFHHFMLTFTSLVWASTMFRSVSENNHL